ncbi:hypothetical protein PPYR_07744 [Photinus pyralis]|uniref:Scavenger receptor class B member 1 n=1 Tax=Photinus pyralis TaxID=7054 RepID=A0A5N4ARA9_PHOPY|nr:protein croquemort-like [Photinus pyralis]KAB0799864.1 hypothetical protein PPYR_07744 [Photinus pyralis]
MSSKKLLFSGIVLTTLGVILLVFWTKICTTVLHSKLVLSNTSLSFKLWKDPPIPIHLSIYLFDWENAETVIKSEWKVKPRFEEKGPFVFSEHHVREISSWNGNGTVSYQQRRIWKFVQSMSNGSLLDNITSVNPIVVILGQKVKNIRFIGPVINSILWYFDEKLYVTKTVNEWLFEGYEDPIISDLVEYHIPGVEIPFDRIGWLYSRNDSATYEGNFTVYTGINDINKLGEMNLWNGRGKTDAYDYPCSLLDGSSGELYSPFNQKQHLSIFLTDICSTLTLERNDTEEVFGIEGAKFIGTDYNFDNGSKYNRQKCFTRNSLPSGVRDISKCKYGAPAFVSYPHFYLADHSYGANVEGLKPDKARHETHITLEPNTGVPLNASAKLQLNLFVDNVKGISVFDNVVPTYMPILWFQEDASLTEKYCNLIGIFQKVLSGGFYFGYVLFGVGLFTMLFAWYSMNGLICRRRYTDLLAEEENES